ncbi:MULTISPECIES: glycosyltransferase [unclassified Pseudodesulfovibrio]|uniref:glycosyltransferase n=1 Tax=unclassified Pseudodesulfovibrio TaxID=2661612 RepID=UPI000FEBB20D|nr:MULTISPECIES: glycosyltransferase [unclassified Pseudodesulfovibrio]MCJ2163447.1 glycosyltransferase [Pseudodesulfovibrio sp. S3-i]RWU06682.1 glycosyltransferase [Pseudodesulfovibrio sp. S3]
MRILITHCNFPAQFRHIAEYLGRDPQNEVVFATENPRLEWDILGVRKAVFQAAESDTENVHPLNRGIAEAVLHGSGLLSLCSQLKAKGFKPDIILGHSGWGQTLYLKDAFPDVQMVSYFEWYYRPDGPETRLANQKDDLGRAMLRMRNTPILHDLVACDVGVTPTAFQKSQFPSEFHSKIHQIHDGIDTRYFAPDPSVSIQNLQLPGVDLSGCTELLTYCARGLEPYRGFPQFYQALPVILDARPTCHVLIVGEDRVCYSPKLPVGRTYKQEMIKRVQVDESRVHFVDPLPYGLYKKVLQASTVHAYLSWPFVLSWSLLEAMSCGCLIVGSNTEPVQEVIADGQNGLLTSFTDPNKIAQDIIQALSHAPDLQHIRKAAHQTILEKYDLSICLPRQIELLTSLVK